jgi:hypothetical protein
MLVAEYAGYAGWLVVATIFAAMLCWLCCLYWLRFLAGYAENVSWLAKLIMLAG